MIDNLTPFGAAAAFAYGLDDTPLVVLAVAATFRMPRAGLTHDGSLAPADDQPPPPVADVHWSDPATSSLRVPGQGHPARSGWDIYLQGSARAPKGRPVTALRTRIRVGACQGEVNVIGDRYWVRGLAGIRPSAPEPFTSKPLRYERAFGGTAKAEDGSIVAQEPRNPIGRGVYARAEDAVDASLHNLEVPGEAAGSWSDRLTPAGYGPIPGAWQPRLAYAGTYDEAWIETRLPLWPIDIDRRFFNAAPSNLVHETEFKGDEPVVLDGFDPDGLIAFRLPPVRILAKSYFGDRVERTLMRLSAVLLDVDSQVATLYWHHTVPRGRRRSGHLRSVVRVLEPWEPLRT